MSLSYQKQKKFNTWHSTYAKIIIILNSFPLHFILPIMINYFLFFFLYPGSIFSNRKERDRTNAVVSVLLRHHRHHNHQHHHHHHHHHNHHNTILTGIDTATIFLFIVLAWVQNALLMIAFPEKWEVFE